jgi:hypothetical protein
MPWFATRLAPYLASEVVVVILEVGRTRLRQSKSGLWEGKRNGNEKSGPLEGRLGHVYEARHVGLLWRSFRLSCGGTVLARPYTPSNDVKVAPTTLKILAGSEANRCRINVKNGQKRSQTEPRQANPPQVSNPGASMRRSDLRAIERLVRSGPLTFFDNDL